MICCPKCKESLEGMKLNFQKVKVCPYCGESLEMGELLETSKDLLKYYVTKNGNEIFLDGCKELLKKIESWPADLKKDADIIKLLNIKNIPTALAKACSLNEEGRAGVLEECENTLINEFGFTSYQARQLLKIVGVPLKLENFYEDTRDGQVYLTTKIGDQVWFAENFRYESDDSKIPAACNENCVSKYGRLYTWKEAKKFAPSGWHLPTVKEWNALVENVSTKYGTALSPLKFFMYNSVGNIEKIGLSKFDACPSGWFIGNTFSDFNNLSVFWLNDETSDKRAYYAWIGKDISSSYRDREDLLAVRYIKD